MADLPDRPKREFRSLGVTKKSYAGQALATHATKDEQHRNGRPIRPFRVRSCLALRNMLDIATLIPIAPDIPLKLAQLSEQNFAPGTKST